MRSCKYYFFTFLLSLLYQPNLSGQLNIKVGYNGGFTKAPVLNNIVTNFNQKYPALEDLLDPFKSIHGAEIGLRYRLNRIGFEVSWNSLSDRSDAIGPISSGNTYQSKWYFSMTEFSAGIENYFGNFGYGAAISTRTARMKTNITGSSRKKREIMNESSLAGKFYLLYQVSGEKVGIAFKPYAQFPMGEMDVSNFDYELNSKLNTSYITQRPQLEKFMAYGISIVLYNGKQ